ncbi:hypothetical protein [Paenibacillus sp. WC2504]|uniref:hypothetical protein n=1 Tax=Paenibacillus sp. WC2504 TaxID=3461403 RepID=UPI0040467774
MKSQKRSRRIRFTIDGTCANFVHYSNPLVPLAWSFFFPGFGFFLMGQFVLGWILFLWEVAVNVTGHFNTAIVYTLTGRPEEATRILEQEGKWVVILYTTTFVFSLWASYVTAVDTNQLTYLAHGENAPVKVFAMNALQYNYLTKRDPWMAVIWSLLMPGLGDVYNKRIISGSTYLIWWIIISYKSHVAGSIYYTALGDFESATSILDPEWFSFLASMWVFAAYNAYIHTVETNKVFDKEQANFLRLNYQQGVDDLYCGKKDLVDMRVIATFDHSPYVEMALVGLERIGIKKNQIYATSLDKRNETPPFIDNIHRSDGQSFLDVASLLAAFLTAVGAIYGFALKGGPVVWGLIGFVVGSVAGVAFQLLKRKKRSKERTTPKTEVVVIVDCNNAQADAVQNIFWHNHAFGISASSPQDID